MTTIQPQGKTLQLTSHVTWRSSDDVEDHVLPASAWKAVDEVAKRGFTINDQFDMQRMGKKQEFRRNFRFLTTVSEDDFEIEKLKSAGFFHLLCDGKWNDKYILSLNKLTMM